MDKRNDIIIVKRKNIIFEKLKSYYKTIRILDLPGDLILFEIQDEFREITHNSDPAIRYSVAIDPQLNARIRKQVKEIQSILAPLYPDEYTWAKEYMLPIGANNYIFKDFGKRKMIGFKIFNQENQLNYYPIYIYIKKNSLNITRQIGHVIEEWIHWANQKEFGIKIIASAKEESVLRVGVSVISNPEDCLAALYWSLNEQVGASKIDHIEFCSTDSGS